MGVIKIKYDKTPKEIEEETGRKFIDICNELKAQGLSDTEIAKKLQLKWVANVSRHFRLERQDLTDPLYPQLTGLQLADLEREFPDIVGMEYKEFLYEKYVIEFLSAYEIAALLGLNYRSVSRHIKKYGYAKNLSTARKDAMKKGIIDYDKINRKSASTRKKSVSRSNIQELIREIFKQHLVEILFERNIADNIEVIVGYDEWSILKHKEVDIPIILCDVNTQHFGKYSVEVNGHYWHNAESDFTKQQALIHSGWKHYIIDANSTSYFNTEQEVVRICNEIVTNFTDDPNS